MHVIVSASQAQERLLQSLFFRFLKRYMHGILFRQHTRMHVVVSRESGGEEGPALFPRGVKQEIHGSRTQSTSKVVSA